MRFSICIPNYNYERYLGETITSVLDQTHHDLEIHVADNASTDGSVALVRGFDDERVDVSVNRCNVGFPANLDRAVVGTSGEWINLLSSDDLMAPTALDTYRRAIEHLGEKPIVLASSCQVIDGIGEPVGVLEPPAWCWRPEDIDPALTDLLGHRTYRLTPDVVLERSLRQLRNPLWFASTVFPRSLYNAVEGYRSQQLMAPDKEFHWRVIAQASEVVFVDAPLYSYRVHASNQNSQQSQSGALKFLLDQYILSFNTDPELRARAGVDQADLARSFVREDIAKRAVLDLIKGDKLMAKRCVLLGRAAYPHLMDRDPLALAARALVATRVVSSPLLHRFEEPLRRRLLSQSTLIKRVRPVGDG